MVVSEKCIEVCFSGRYGYWVAPESAERVQCQMATVKALLKKGFIETATDGPNRDVFGAVYRATPDGWDAADQFIRGGY
jgi:hypothetical protein